MLPTSIYFPFTTKDKANLKHWKIYVVPYRVSIYLVVEIIKNNQISIKQSS